MTDYTYPAQDDLSDKDGLASGNAEKIILGSDLEAEFTAVATAIASKYDSSDLASEAQAQAEASNATLMTPLRVGQWADANGGLVGDIHALADPGADRLLFWDDSAGAAAFLSIGTGLSLSGTTLAADEAAIDHDSLSGFVANEHIDHSGVTLTAGEGLSGGGTIVASRSFALDFSGLTQETTLDLSNDVVAFYDASAGSHRKVPLENVFASARLLRGDGRWYRSTSQALSASTAATVVFNSADYNQLQRGTFSTSTGQYTVGSSATRVLVTAGIKVASMPVDSSLIVAIQVNGTTVASIDILLQAGTGVEDRQSSIAVPLSLSASDVVRVRVTPSNNAMNIGGSKETYVGIVELA